MALKQNQCHSNIHNVYQQFNFYLDAKTSEFTVPNPESLIRDGIKRAYSFNNLTIKPEWVSLTAASCGMDDDSVDPILSEHDYYMDVEYKIGFFSDDYTYNLTHTATNLADVMKDINQHWDAKKPPGMTKSPVSIDWIHDNIAAHLHDPEIMRQEIDEVRLVWYENDDAFAVETHKNVLPESMRNVHPPLNNYKLPSFADTLKDVRVRIGIAPNTKVSFSNEAFFKLLGFTDDDIGPRGAASQYHIVNSSMTEVMMLEASSPPTPSFTIEKSKTSRIYVSKVNKKLTLNGHYRSTLKREADPSLLLADFAESIREMTRNLYFTIKASKNPLHRFIVEFPAYDKIDFKMVLPNQLASQLGFATTTITKTDFIADKVIERAQQNLTEGLEKSKVLVIDTGSLLVSLGNVPSMNTIGHASQTMAVLLSDNESAMVMIPHLRPSILLSPNDSFLTFIISRQSGTNQKIRLAWPCNYFVVGTLEGIPI